MGRTITFSFKTDGSSRLNSYVSKVAVYLRKKGFSVELRHGSGINTEGSALATIAAGLNDGNFMSYWTDQAQQSHLVVCFDNGLLHPLQHTRPLRYSTLCTAPAPTRCAPHICAEHSSPVCVIVTDDYMASEYCQKELRYAKSNYIDNYITVGRYMDTMEPQDMADHIHSKMP